MDLSKDPESNTPTIKLKADDEIGETWLDIW